MTNNGDGDQYSDRRRRFYATGTWRWLRNDARRCALNRQFSALFHRR